MEPRSPMCLAAAWLVAGLGLAACSGAGPATPALVPPVAVSQTAPLMIRIDGSCAGRESHVQVFVDRVPIGVVNPGDNGLFAIVTVGSHELSAQSQQGTQWGPFPTSVLPDGGVETLGCMPNAL